MESRFDPPELAVLPRQQLPDAYLGLLSGLLIRGAKIDAQAGPFHDAALHVAARTGQVSARVSG